MASFLQKFIDGAEDYQDFLVCVAPFVIYSFSKTKQI